jgi:transposase
MKVSLWAEIRRLNEIERLSGHKIAAKLGCSRKTVRRALRADQPPIRQAASRTKRLDPFHDRIAAILAKDPDLSAVRILEKISKPEGDSAGYQGSITQLRVYLQSIRTAKRRVYQDIHYEPGEAMQVDWGDVGPIRIGSTTRKVSVFVAVLCHSKMIYIEFTLSQKKSEFYRSIVHALEFFGGTPRKIVFDNLKAAVLSGSGRSAVLHPEFEALCGHYYLQPIACEARDPESKGLVENTVRYVKKNALAGRSDELQSWDDYRHLAIHWRDTVANVRVHDRLGEKPIDRFKVEKLSLRPLPSIGYPTEEIVLTEVRSTAVVEFDCNRYTVPPQFAGQNVTLLASSDKLRILHKGAEIAMHVRSYEKRFTVSNPQHKLDALLMRGKQRASELATNFATLGPEAQAFQLALSKLPVRASVHLKRIVQLIDLYGRESVLKALSEALLYKTIDAAYVEMLVVQARRKASLPSPTLVQPKRKELIQLELELPDPGRYDRFTYEDDDEQSQA